MRTTAAALFLFLLSLLPACRSSYSGYHVAADEYVLATREADGKKETYRLNVRGDALRLTTESQRSRPFLGLKVVEIDKAQAEKRGIKPYSGLLVTGTYEKSAAAEAGIEAGDVVVSIGGKETVYLQHVAAAEAALAGKGVAAVSLLRGQTAMDLDVPVRLLEESVTETQDITLEASGLLERPYAGVTLRGIPAVWCERIFGASRQAVAVTSVEVGSPAWIAGVRAGDVIDQVDGQPVPAVGELSRRIVAQGEAEATMQWAVRRGPSDTHLAEIHLEDYSGESRFWFPFVFAFENGVVEDEWSVGPLALVMHNKNQYVANTATRRVQTRNVFSMILGLFRVDSGPQETEVRLLWFIHFDT